MLNIALSGYILGLGLHSSAWTFDNKVEMCLWKISLNLSPEESGELGENTAQNETEQQQKNEYEPVVEE